MVTGVDVKIKSKENTLDLSKSAKLALPVVFNILDKWQCSQDNQMAILGLSNSFDLNKYRTMPNTVEFPADLLERMSYLLNIHKGLSTLFSNDDTIYNWVNKPNDHPFFAGQSAIDIMKKGRVSDLYDVASRIDSYRDGLS